MWKYLLNPESLSPQSKLRYLTQRQIASDYDYAVALDRKQRLECEALERPRPGRPKQELPLLPPQTILPQSVDESELEKEKLTRIDWFSSPFIHDILAAYNQYNSSFLAVKSLKSRFPRLSTETSGRFDGLHRNTVQSWFDKDHKLLPQYQARIDALNWKKPGGRISVFSGESELEEKLVSQLLLLRDNGTKIGIREIRILMRALAAKLGTKESTLQILCKKHNISRWARSHPRLQWRFRVGTQTAGKLPENWVDQGTDFVHRIAALVKQYKISQHLVINYDQTGLHLVPNSKRTYEKKGLEDVKILGEGDKRQITAVMGSCLDGALLPLQLIYEGKTTKCEVSTTAESIQHGFLISHSENHWSTQETMEQYFELVIQPFIAKQIATFDLKSNSRAIVILDCWNVHKSKEFMSYVRTKHKNILLVFVPANCTGKFQVADVALNFPFKHFVKVQFEDWSMTQIINQLETGNADSTKPLSFSNSLTVLKPLSLEWSLKSWLKLQDRSDLICKAWRKSFNALDPFESKLQDTATERVLKNELQAYGFIPDEKEETFDAQYYNNETDSESDNDELDVMKRRVEGTRKSQRSSRGIKRYGYQIDSQHIDLREQSESELD